jgi:uncharacterized protein YecE (DUF72 family)
MILFLPFFRKDKKSYLSCKPCLINSNFAIGQIIDLLRKEFQAMKIHVGTSGYSYKEWKGNFYPEKISPKEMLHFYSQRLGTVEINNTFYGMPTAGVLESWAGQVPDDFLFAIKAPQVITHVKRLKDAGEETEYFFKTLSVLGDKLGPILFQFPKTFRPDSQRLENFFSLIPKNASCAFEFRSAAGHDSEIHNLLHERGLSLVNADTEDDPVDEIIKTASWGYLRLRRPDYTDVELSSWLKKIISQKWERAFIYFKHEEAGKGAEMALRFAGAAGRSPLLLSRMPG